jgi:hypothetical protein
MDDVEKYAENNPSIYEQNYLQTRGEDSILSRKLKEIGDTSYEDDMASPGERSFFDDADGRIHAVGGKVKRVKTRNKKGKYEKPMLIFK